MTFLKHLPRFRLAYQSRAESAASEQWSRGDIESLQLERLNAVWSHATCHVPYYRDMAAAANLPPRFTSLGGFRAAVPVLPRSRVHAAPNDFYSERALSGRWKVSGGSTGEPTAFFWPHEAHYAIMRAKYRFHAMWNLDIFDRLAFLWGHAASFAPGLPGMTARWMQPVTDRLRNRIRLSAYRLGSADSDTAMVDVARIVSGIAKAVEGYPVSLEIVDALEANLAGKHRWIVSDLADDNTEASRGDRHFHPLVERRSHQDVSS